MQRSPRHLASGANQWREKGPWKLSNRHRFGSGHLSLAREQLVWPSHCDPPSPKFHHFPKRSISAPMASLSAKGIGLGR